MPLAPRRALAAFAFSVLTLATTARASDQDWPQWRGANGDAKASGFVAPRTWPKALVKKWSIEVGEGVATPALVGDRLYVFSRQADNEILRCMSVTDGKEIWQDKYPSLGATGPAAAYSGPRGCPVWRMGKWSRSACAGCLPATTPPAANGSGRRMISAAQPLDFRHPPRRSSSTVCASRNSVTNPTARSRRMT